MDPSPEEIQKVMAYLQQQTQAAHTAPSEPSSPEVSFESREPSRAPDTPSRRSMDTVKLSTSD